MIVFCLVIRRDVMTWELEFVDDTVSLLATSPSVRKFSQSGNSSASSSRQDCDRYRQKLPSRLLLEKQDGALLFNRSEVTRFNL